MLDYQSFVKWQAEDPYNRYVKIELDDTMFSGRPFVYDRRFTTGQRVSRVEDIDLMATYKKNLEDRIKELERLEG